MSRCLRAPAPALALDLVLARVLALGLALILALAAPTPTSAHEGPPYPIVVDHAAGPVTLSAWADPDVGTGTFHVYLEPAGSAKVADGSRVSIVVQPADGRLPESAHEAEPYRVKPQRHHLVAEVPFDAVGAWTVRFEIESGGHSAQASTTVDVTPPGQGPVLDFVLYLLPFVATGFLVVRALVAKRRALRSAAPDRTLDPPP